MILLCLKYNFIYLGLFAYGFISGVNFINIESTIPRLFSNLYSISSKQSIIQIIEQSTMILGPAIASVFIYYHNLKFTLIIGCGVFFINGLLMRFNLIKHQLISQNVSHEHHILKDFVTTIKILITNKKLLFLTFSTSILNFIGAICIILAPKIFHIFHKPDFLYGVLTTLSAIFSITFLIFLVKKSNKFNLTIVGLISLITLIIGLILQSQNIFLLYFIGFLIFQCTLPFYVVFMRTKRAMMIPESLFASCIGIIVFINSLSLPLSGLFISMTSNFILPNEILELSYILLIIMFHLL